MYSASNQNQKNTLYKVRYKEIKDAENILNTQYLGTLTKNQLCERYFENKIIFKRAKHVIYENHLVKIAKISLKENNIKQFGNLMNKSQKSYSKNFEVSNDNIDLIVDRSLKSSAYGCKLTVWGFGGFTISLIEENKYNNWYKKMLVYYDKKKFLKL